MESNTVNAAEQNKDNNFKVYIALAVLGILGVFVFILSKSSNIEPNNATDVLVETAPNEKISASPNYSSLEISEHSSESDCWLAVEGQVYDVTEFIPSHPGGDKILAGCGKDATNLFTVDGSGGRKHSNTAKQLIEDYKIGELVN